ncbi:hypothetical protein D9M71_583290 [compost metagenome]
MVPKLEFIVLQRPAQVAFQAQTLLQALGHVRVIQPPGIAPALLGGIHGSVGMAQQTVAALAVFRVPGKTDAAGNQGRVAIEIKR